MNLINKTLQAIKNEPSYFVVSLITFILLLIMLNNASWINNEAMNPSVVTLEEQVILEPIDPPDFTAFNVVSEKKQAFFDFLRPLIRQENLKIQYDRALLQSIKESLSREPEHKDTSIRKLKKLAEKYHLKLININKTIAKLERRIATIPESLVLVQAANESAWGTSRFAIEANNYFGQWCYSKGCGVVPANRSDEAAHEIREFANVKESVVSYMKNLNTYYAYSTFRQIRQELIKSGQLVTGSKLALGLKSYSQRGDDYVNDLITMIGDNNLESIPVDNQSVN